jgi:non-canonical (house-cleaning) NTP pyrophosphatase
MGAIGILTNGLSNRRKATEEVIAYAMAKKLRPELYR